MARTGFVATKSPATYGNDSATPTAPRTGPIQTFPVTDLNAAYVAAGAALSASALTISGTYGLERIREHRAAKAAKAARRRALYAEFLNAVGDMLVNSASLRAISDITGKWFHSLNQLFKRSPEQPTTLEILELFHAPMNRLMNAWADAYLVFEQDEIDAVNTLVEAVQAIDHSLAIDDPASMEAKLGAARREFALFARTKIGASAVRLEPLE